VALVSPGRLKVLDDGISMNNCQLGAHYSPTVCPTSYCSEHRAICSAPQSEKSLLRWEGGQLQSKPFERDAWIVLRSGFGGPEVYCGHMPKLVIQDGHQSPSREASLVTRSEGGSRREVGQSKSVVHAACLSVQ
jgi:hypothetical protein